MVCSFPSLEAVCCSMPNSNCSFLTCIQISQEAGKVVWCSQTEVDGFLNSLAFLMIQWMLAIWFLVPLSFLKPAWTSGSLWFTALKPGLENFEYYFTSVWDECNCVVVWAFFGIAFLRDWSENWPFPVLWPLLSFPNLLAYWVQHFHSIIFQDLK